MKKHALVARMPANAFSSPRLPSTLPGLQTRVARHLGWSEADVRSFSLAALRELVSPKLAYLITEHMRGMCHE